jgi:hypothetical protein
MIWFLESMKDAVLLKGLYNFLIDGFIIWYNCITRKFALINF